MVATPTTTKFQPLTYWGAAGTFVIMAIVGAVGIFYRVKQAIERRRDAKVRAAEQAVAADRADKRRSG